MSHRNRQQATHYLTAEREVQSTNTDDYGQPLPGTPKTVIEDEPVRLVNGGTEFIRSEAGEVVESSDRVVGGAALEPLEEGDTISLAPVSSEGTVIDDLEARSIKESYGRYSEITSITVELEAV